MFSIENKDQHIWNKNQTFKDLFQYFLNNKNNLYLLTTANEGPCLQSSGIEKFIVDVAKTANANLQNIRIRNGNLLLSAKIIKEKKINSLTELYEYQGYVNNQDFSAQKNIKFNFGQFIGRSNFLRLWIGTHLFTYYKEKSLQTYHWAINDDFHKENLDLEMLLNVSADFDLIHNSLELLRQCPIVNETQQTYPIQNNSVIRNCYKSIFIDIICESYYSGNVFFLTEKTWRPIEQMTPFIVQGPQFFLKNLKLLGFETFSKWWPETYDDYNFYARIPEILKLIDEISTWSIDKCKRVYDEMTPVLEKNKNRLKTLTWDEIKTIKFVNTESNMP